MRAAVLLSASLAVHLIAPPWNAGWGGPCNKNCCQSCSVSPFTRMHCVGPDCPWSGRAGSMHHPAAEGCSLMHRHSNGRASRDHWVALRRTCLTSCPMIACLHSIQSYLPTAPHPVSGPPCSLITCCFQQVAGHPPRRMLRAQRTPSASTAGHSSCVKYRSPLRHTAHHPSSQAASARPHPRHLGGDDSALARGLRWNIFPSPS